MLRKFFAFAALPMVLSCAPFQAASAENDLTPQQTTLIDSTCRNVLGLRPGEQYYGDCQDSLTQTMTRIHVAGAMASAADICRARGLPQGSAALSVCMLNQESSAPQPVAANGPAPAAFTDAALETGKSYYDVTPTTRWHRERYACAQLGLMPNTGLFGECVGSLEGEFMPDE